MTAAGFSPQAQAALEKLYADPARETLADRVEETLDLLDEGPPFHIELRRHRLQVRDTYRVMVSSGRPNDYVVIVWNSDQAGRAWVHYLGPDWIPGQA